MLKLITVDLYLMLNFPSIIPGRGTAGSFTESSYDKLAFSDCLSNYHSLFFLLCFLSLSLCLLSLVNFTCAKELTQMWRACQRASCYRMPSRSILSSQLSVVCFLFVFIISCFFVCVDRSNCPTVKLTAPRCA